MWIGKYIIDYFLVIAWTENKIPYLQLFSKQILLVNYGGPYNNVCGLCTAFT